MSKFQSKKLPPGYAIKQISAEEFKAQGTKISREVFDVDVYGYWSDEARTPAEKKRLKKLNEFYSWNYRLYLGVYYKNKLVGWSTGYQTGRDTYCMANSALLKSHRGKGLYSALLSEVMKIVIAKGFLRIESSHLITNNKIIITKLKAGFHISGTKVIEFIGSVVDLIYHVHPVDAEVYNFRVGYKPTKRVREILKLDA